MSHQLRAAVDEQLGHRAAALATLRSASARGRRGNLALIRTMTEKGGA
jgi:hypothetical protein